MRSQQSPSMPRTRCENSPSADPRGMTRGGPVSLTFIWRAVAREEDDDVFKVRGSLTPPSANSSKHELDGR